MNSRKVYIRNEEYLLISNYKDIDNYRHSLNRLTQQTFSFDFEQWYQQGYWSDKYRPYSLLHNNEIVANVSANPIDYLIDGELHHILQIGTVMTDKAYRNKGLNGLLMKAVLEEYEDVCEMIYLYANDSVLDFYPRYGFSKANEYIHTKIFYSEESRKVSGESTAIDTKHLFRRLNLQLEIDMAILNRLVLDTIPVSRISMIDNPGLKMFYLRSVMSENIYYNEELDLAAVVEYDGDTMTLIDLFCPHAFDLEVVIRSLINQPVTTVKLGFTPQDEAAFTATPLKVEDSTFFIKMQNSEAAGSGANLIGHGRFPILSHA